MKPVQYVAGEPCADTGWKSVRQWRMTLEPGEFTLIWASIQVRITCLSQAEKTFANYRHKEPLVISGIKRLIEIGSPLSILKKPLLVGLNESGKDLIPIIRRGEQAGKTWRLHEEQGLQAITSIGWLADITKARQPPITKDLNAQEFDAALFPTNTKVVDEEVPSGYNKRQMALMEDTRQWMHHVLEPLPSLDEAWTKCTLIVFGEKLFRTASRIISSLPDPEEEERQRFETIKQKAQAQAAKDDDD